MIDTERVVPTATGGGVDVTLIPSMLVARTEVVTGGASAVYGSDAVAGVVNIILDKKLDGFKGQADYGQTRTTMAATRISPFGYGRDLGDGRAHFIIGAEYENSEDIGICSQVRSWCKSRMACTRTASMTGLRRARALPFPERPASLHHRAQCDARQPEPDRRADALRPARRRGLHSRPDRSTFSIPPAPRPRPSIPAYADGAGVFGFSEGAGATGVGAYDGTTLRPAVKRYTGLTDLDFKITRQRGLLPGGLRRAQFCGESRCQWRHRSRSPWKSPPASSCRSAAISRPTTPICRSSSRVAPMRWPLQTGSAAILQPNPFPCGNTLGGALLGYNMNAIDPARNQTDNETIRFTGGLKGTISSDLDLGYVFRVGSEHEQPGPAEQRRRHLSAVCAGCGPAKSGAAGSASNPVVCRATDPTYYPAAYSAAAAGCVPLNLFGANNANPAALAYAFRTLVEYSTLKEEVLSGNIGGDLFSGFGAGPVKASFGVEVRRDTADVTHDLADQPFYDEYFLSYGLDYAGQISVAEGYGEINVPVLKDLPLAKYLEFDGAIRETDNENEDETAGSATDGVAVKHIIPSWKLSSIWDLTDWFRIRGTRSRDVRAAGFRELYESYAVTAGGPFGTVTNPANNQSEVVTALTGGNINLEPEKADTTTVGFVIAPKSGPLERFQFSADWYRIILHDPITGPPFGLGVQNIVNLCYAGSAGVLRSHYLRHPRQLRHHPDRQQHGGEPGWL